MKKLSILIVALVAGVGLWWLVRSGNGSSQTAASSGGSVPLSSSGNASSNSTSYKDGTYTGDIVYNGYGDVQVAAVVSGGKITDIQFLQMPSGGHSSEVTSVASPMLKQEALQAQSANVDIVSGATQTSEAFMQSLQAALTKA